MSVGGHHGREGLEGRLWVALGATIASAGLIFGMSEVVTRIEAPGSTPVADEAPPVPDVSVAATAP